MESLGDFFPKEEKEKFASNSIESGSIFFKEVSETFPPKKKYFIVVGHDKEKVYTATVFINSAINPNLFPTEELRQLHLKIETNHYSFLKHDSYIDCSQIKERNIEKLKSQIAGDPGIHIGYLQKSDLAEIHKIIKSARTISERDKKKFGLFS